MNIATHEQTDIVPGYQQDGISAITDFKQDPTDGRLTFAIQRTLNGKRIEGRLLVYSPQAGIQNQFQIKDDRFHKLIATSKDNRYFLRLQADNTNEIYITDTQTKESRLLASTNASLLYYPLKGHFFNDRLVYQIPSILAGTFDFSNGKELHMIDTMMPIDMRENYFTTCQASATHPCANFEFRNYTFADVIQTIPLDGLRGEKFSGTKLLETKPYLLVFTTDTTSREQAVNQHIWMINLLTSEKQEMGYLPNISSRNSHFVESCQLNRDESLLMCLDWQGQGSSFTTVLHWTELP